MQDFCFFQTVVKTLNNGRENIFAVHRVRDELVCPVHAVKAYARAAELMGFNINSKYLFRPLVKNKLSVLSGYLLYSLVYER